MTDEAIEDFDKTIKILGGAAILFFFIVAAASILQHNSRVVREGTASRSTASEHLGAK